MAKKIKEKPSAKATSKPVAEEKKENIIKNIFAPVKNEIGQFIVGLVLALVAFYMLIAFISFFTTGAADQSILEAPAPGELGVDNEIKNSTGAIGAQMANYLINGCFGISSFFIVLFIGVAGFKLMKAYKVKLSKWFICCSLLLVWFSVALGFLCGTSFAESHIIPGGLHGYNVSNWLTSQIGAPGVWLLLLVTAILFAIYLSRETISLIRKMLHPNIPLDKLKRHKNSSPTEENIFSDKEKKIGRGNYL